MNKPSSWKAAGIMSALWAAAAIALPAQTFTTLDSFQYKDGTPADPYSGLVQATDGNLYGTTVLGGSLRACNFGCGSTYRITLGGTVTTLYSFCVPRGCRDGDSPYAPLIQASDGNLYGTTYGGGPNGNNGTVFKMTSDGKLKTLHDFCAQSGCPDGRNPYAALIQGLDRNFYGTTPGGGANDSGTVYKITPGGTLTTLYSFCAQSGCADGRGPTALVQAADGNLYGITSYGGAGGPCTSGCGTVFKITPSGTLTTLHSFHGTDGSAPDGALAQATDGSLYGTTESGGSSTLCTLGGGLIGCGTIFKITPSGTLTTLYSFCSQSGCPDGEFPSAPLVQATDGGLYGMTPFGGANSSCLAGLGCGTIFKITRSGALTTLYSFCSQSNCADGENSYAGLVQDTDGKFYGTAPGGVYSAGTVFSLDVGLGAFVKTQLPAAKVGVAVNILGTNLTGATSVTFNGTAATFTVASSSLITATVPAGATTGSVQVVTPDGTLSSNVPFRVLP